MDYSCVPFGYLINLTQSHQIWTVRSLSVSKPVASFLFLSHAQPAPDPSPPGPCRLPACAAPPLLQAIWCPLPAGRRGNTCFPACRRCNACLPQPLLLCCLLLPCCRRRTLSTAPAQANQGGLRLGYDL
ncbi:hypothetical protein U9M48_044179 [Paspalum notatum var. saurae]|uniref:Uncharacterized protein n=1 Tax=Paspalum notatum var. saurae TaxID=547442 RepID=A0AAQ3XGD4_PASNO